MPAAAPPLARRARARGGGAEPAAGERSGRAWGEIGRLICEQEQRARERGRARGGDRRLGHPTAVKEPCGRADRPPPDRRGLVHPSEPCRARAARRRAHRARAAAAPASTRGPECTARRAPHLAASAARQLRTKPGAPRPPPRASPSCSRAWPAARRPARPRLSPRAARGAATFPATASTFGGDQEGAFVGGERHRLAPDINDARRASRSGEGSEDASTRASPVDPRRSLAWRS